MSRHCAPLLATLLLFGATFAPSSGSALQIALQAADGSAIRADGETYEGLTALLETAGHDVDVVSASAIDTLPEISQYDVVVLYGGVSQREAGLEYRKIDAVIEDYVWGGGGVIVSGWTLSFMAMPPVRSRACQPDACDPESVENTCGCANSQYCDSQSARCKELFDLPGLNSIMPQKPGFEFDGDGGEVDFAAHPITKRLRNFSIAPPPEGTFSQTSGPLRPGASLLSTIDGVDESSAWILGEGGVVHLGPIYTAEAQVYSNEELFDGSIPSAQRLFINSVEWAANPPVCGNGDVDSGEDCDDGNDDNTDSCLNTCQDAFCGDGFLQEGEQCDDGFANSDDQPNACRTDCQIASCGDGVVDRGESCDQGELNGESFATCSSVCTIKQAEVCADGECSEEPVDQPEEPTVEDAPADAPDGWSFEESEPRNVETFSAPEGCGGCRTGSGGGSGVPMALLLVAFVLAGRLRNDDRSPAS